MIVVFIINKMALSVVAQESEVLSIIRYREAPRKSLGNYKKNHKKTKTTRSSTFLAIIGRVKVYKWALED